MCIHIIWMSAPLGDIYSYNVLLSHYSSFYLFLRLLLLLADFENNKKRFLKEREDRRRSSVANFATRMIQVGAKRVDF